MVAGVLVFATTVSGTASIAHARPPESRPAAARTLPLITVRAREASRYAYAHDMRAGIAVMDTAPDASTWPVTRTTASPARPWSRS